MVNSVVSAINAALSSLDAVIYGISTPTIIEGSDESRSIVPAMVDEYGECKYVDPEDQNPLTIYHRLYGNQYPIVSKGFGDSNGMSIIYDMAIICFGTRAKIRLTPDVVERQIASRIPQAVDGCKVSVISADFDQNRVFASEFSNVVNFLSPDLFLFSVKYKITCNYNSLNCLKNNT